MDIPWWIGFLLGCAVVLLHWRDANRVWIALGAFTTGMYVGRAIGAW
jgi:hypothetical protein